VASYHINISAPLKSEGSALEHSMYIQREGRFTEEKYGQVVARGLANFPEWARKDPNAFWKASDQFERANGTVYREYELALPRELSRDQQVALVQRFAEQELGAKRAYQWAIHAPMAKDGLEQPHVHLMFSDRQMDGIERSPEQFFKRYNAQHPELGGCRKATYGANRQEAALVYEQIRERWGKAQNLALEHAGLEVRVDHRSLADQGIRDREPQLHRGPAVSGIEARGQVSEVGQRQLEQRQARAQSRALVVAEVRVVTRQEMALEKMAVRERRELAREVTGPGRELVLPLLEADRREQLERTQAKAERRIERRQELGIGGQLKEKLLTQARVLRERIGQQLGRVREWVAERFPEVVEQIKQLSRDGVEALSKGRFQGLKLGKGNRKPEAFAEMRLAASERAPKQRALNPAEHFELAVDRYARAWSDAARMGDLPVLEHQKLALKEAGLELDRARPGAKRDLLNSLRHEPRTRRAITELQGKERVAALVAGIDHEEKIRANPKLKAQRLVKEWDGLESERKRLQGWEHSEARGQVEEQLKTLARELKQDPALENYLRERQKALGITRDSSLSRVMKEQNIERAIELSVRERSHSLGLSR